MFYNYTKHSIGIVLFSFSILSNCQSDLAYPQAYKDIAKIMNWKIGVCVTAYNRPTYFRQTLAAFELNPESESLPFFFILDGGPKATQFENKELIVNSKIKSKEIIYRDRNYGCGRNIIDARRFMFDWCGFEIVFFFEDDLIVSSSYFSVLKNIYNWSRRFQNIGVVQGWNKCLLTYEEKIPLAKHIKELPGPIAGSGADLWGWVLHKDAWRSIKPILYAFEKLFLKNIDYCARDHKTIRSWLISTIPPLLIEKKCPVLQDPNKQCPRMHKNIPRYGLPADLSILTSNYSSQDAVTLLALAITGYKRLATTVNRVIYIGADGVHFFPALWKSLGYDQMHLDEMPEDALIQDFELT